MDSPFLPNLRGRAAPDSPSEMIADISLSPTPLSPDPSVSRRAHFAAQPPSPTRTTTSDLEGSRGGSASAGVAGGGGGGANRGKPRFSLFAPGAATMLEPRSSSDLGAEVEEEHEEVDEYDQEQGEDADTTVHHARAGQGVDREDKLRESLYELRQMNEVFDGFLGALEAARGHNERLAARVNQTSALLDQYVSLLGQAEHTQRLLSNPHWTGALDDAAAVEAEAAARAEAEVQALEAARAAEAAKVAAAEKAKQDEQAAAARVASGQSARGGVRGRGVARGGAGVTRGQTSGIPRTTGRGGATGSGTGTGTGTGTSGIARPTSGLGGKYANVKSSGYGPSSRKA